MRHPFDTVEQMRDHLHTLGISRALVSHLGGVFLADPISYNAEMVLHLQKIDGLYPVPLLNLRLPTYSWKAELERYLDNEKVRAVKIIPTFHDYRLNTRPVYQLVELLEQADRRLILTMRMEDERTRYFGLKIKGLPVKDIVRLHQRYPETAFLCQNVYLPEARIIGDETATVCVDTAFSEWLFTAEELRKHLPAERIFLGTHTPLFYTEASLAKIRDANIPDVEKELILTENSTRFFGI